MMQRAHNHVRAANLLGRRLGGYGDSATQLSALAFEIALKAVHLSATGQRAESHNYWSIWRRLPTEIQDEIIHSASMSYAGHIDLTEPKAVLDGLQKVFTHGRYDYEFNQGLTANQVAEKGRLWVEAGARLEDADIRFYPMERDGFLFGLFEWIEKTHGFEFDLNE